MPETWDRECSVCGRRWTGAAHDECPNRYPRVLSEKCACENGCNECDWSGTRMWTAGGHQWVRPVGSLLASEWRAVKNG
jgi:hypothetical protein